MPATQSDDIERFRANIDDAIRQVNAQQAFASESAKPTETLTAQGLTITSDKAMVMRALSTRFPRDQMRRVYAAIVPLGD